MKSCAEACLIISFVILIVENVLIFVMFYLNPVYKLTYNKHEYDFIFEVRLLSEKNSSLNRKTIT